MQFHDDESLEVAFEVALDVKVDELVNVDMLDVHGLVVDVVGLYLHDGAVHLDAVHLDAVHVNGQVDVDAVNLVDI